MNDRDADTIEFPRPGPPSGRSGFGLLIIIGLGLLLFGGSAALSYYVDALWFRSLGTPACSGRRCGCRASSSR